MQALTNSDLSLPPLIQDLLRALAVALAFSAFIYFARWDITFGLTDSLLGLGALWGLLTQNRRVILLSGFFIGLLWFYWIGYSFTYYDVGWMTPLVTVGFGFVYLLFFGTLAVTGNVWIRALMLFGLSFAEPFDFNWMQIELIFINSYFGIEKWQFAVILSVLSLFATLKGPLRYAALLLLAFALVFPAPARPLPPLAVKLVGTILPQEVKWLPRMRESIIEQNFRAIDEAIGHSYNIVVLPESAFPLYLNHAPDLITRLEAKSFQITIITGALFEEKRKNYNVTYKFSNGRYTIAKKTVLVPFGEYVPLPKFAREWVNRTFFAGSSDYNSAPYPTDFIIGGEKFRNAVCYEATCEELYYDNPAYILAISNNGWFTPSIEPTLQRLLMLYYARKHNTVIFHAANSAGTGIVRGQKKSIFRATLEMY